MAGRRNTIGKYPFMDNKSSVSSLLHPDLEDPSVLSVSEIRKAHRRRQPKHAPRTRERSEPKFKNHVVEIVDNQIHCRKSKNFKPAPAKPKHEERPVKPFENQLRDHFRQDPKRPVFRVPVVERAEYKFEFESKLRAKQQEQQRIPRHTNRQSNASNHKPTSSHQRETAATRTQNIKQGKHFHAKQQYSHNMDTYPKLSKKGEPFSQSNPIAHIVNRLHQSWVIRAFLDKLEEQMPQDDVLSTSSNDDDVNTDGIVFSSEEEVDRTQSSAVGDNDPEDDDHEASENTTSKYYINASMMTEDSLEPHQTTPSRDNNTDTNSTTRPSHITSRGVSPAYTVESLSDFSMDEGTPNLYGHFDDTNTRGLHYGGKKFDDLKGYLRHLQSHLGSDDSESA